jgi:hypothetical protein
MRAFQLLAGCVVSLALLAPAAHAQAPAQEDTLAIELSGPPLSEQERQAIADRLNRFFKPFPLPIPWPVPQPTPVPIPLPFPRMTVVSPPPAGARVISGPTRSADVAEFRGVTPDDQSRNFLCRAACNAAAAAAAAGCAGAGAPPVVAACLAAADTARRECLRRC